jgi:hypothetical protein
MDTSGAPREEEAERREGKGEAGLGEVEVTLEGLYGVF